MLSDLEIQNLIGLPKMIGAKSPNKGYKEENGHERCDLDLEATSTSGAKFTAFIRRHNKFIENFSIGLRYQTDDRSLGTITLVRYNGAHGEVSRQPDGHYAKPHIHRMTAAEIVSGNTQPQEGEREVTDRYSTYEQALTVFFIDSGVANYEVYFPGLLQGRLFNGHQ